MTGHIVGHLVRRGFQHLAELATPEQRYVNQLEKDARLYEDSGPEMELKPQDLLPVFIIGLLTLLIIWSVRINSLTPYPYRTRAGPANSACRSTTQSARSSRLSP
jgi:hypothetical protein